jgi:type IV secretion system protein VirB4
MWMQYLRAQAKTFDLDKHARLLTYLLGGHWYDLGSPSLRLQPLRSCADPLKRGLLLQWLLEVCAAQGATINAYTQRYLRGALEALAKHKPQERTWDAFLRLLAAKPEGYLHEIHNHRIRTDVQGVGHEDIHLRLLEQHKAEIRWALQDFRDIFGADEDTLPVHPVQTFELRDLMGQSKRMQAVMGYVMLEVSQQMTTQAPMLLFLDDAAVPWLTPKGTAGGQQAMEAQLKDWLMSTRKKGVSLGFSTHSLGQVFESPLGALLAEGCPLQFYLPNPAALTPRIRRIYEEMGRSETAIQTIATARAQRDVYFVHEEAGERLFSLAHGPFTLDCIARNSAEDHALMDELLAKEGREGFPAAWFRAHGWDDAAHKVEHWIRQQGRNHDETITERHLAGQGSL